MLYFSKIKIILISIFTLSLVYLTSANFFNTNYNWIDRKINLGLDLQGGSYLLLEIDNTPVITQKLQNKVSNLRKFFKDKNINFKNLKIVNNKTILFEINSKQIESTKKIFEDKNDNINPYYDRYKAFAYDLLVEDNQFSLNLSKYGLIEIKNSSLDQAIEIVRRRVDELGTN